MKPSHDIAVIGLGNTLLRDEGVGVKVIEELKKSYDFSPPVKVIDGGTSGFALITEVEGCKKLIVVDAVKAGNEPGTIYKFKRGDVSVQIPQAISVHDFGFIEALEQWKLLGFEPEVIFFGIEPADMSSWGFDLTPIIIDKMPRFVELVIEELKSEGITVTGKK